jgi:hypothetical protein
MSRVVAGLPKNFLHSLLLPIRNLYSFFVLPGQNPGDIQLQAAVEQEFAQYKDLVQGNFIDSYFNNTWKTALGLRWAVEHCPKEGNITVPIHYFYLPMYLHLVLTSPLY